MIIVGFALIVLALALSIVDRAKGESSGSAWIRFVRNCCGSIGGAAIISQRATGYFGLAACISFAVLTCVGFWLAKDNGPKSSDKWSLGERLVVGGVAVSILMIATVLILSGTAGLQPWVANVSSPSNGDAQKAVDQGAAGVVLAYRQGVLKPDDHRQYRDGLVREGRRIVPSLIQVLNYQEEHSTPDPKLVEDIVEVIGTLIDKRIADKFSTDHSIPNVVRAAYDYLEKKSP
jgi:hypothetical protein